MYCGWIVHLGGGVTVPEGCTTRTKLTTTCWRDWHWHRVVAEDSTFGSCGHPQILQTYTANGRLTSSAIVLRGLTSSPVFLFVCLVGCFFGTAVQRHWDSFKWGLQAAGATVAALPHALPARTPLQWGGNWTDHTLFTHFIAKMKWVVPKHAVTDRGGRRSLFHQRHIF